MSLLALTLPITLHPGIANSPPKPFSPDTTVAERLSSFVAASRHVPLVGGEISAAEAAEVTAEDAWRRERELLAG